MLLESKRKFRRERKKWRSEIQKQVNKHSQWHKRSCDHCLVSLPKPSTPKLKLTLFLSPQVRGLADEIAKAWHSCFPFSLNSVLFYSYNCVSSIISITWSISITKLPFLVYQHLLPTFTREIDYWLMHGF